MPPRTMIGVRRPHPADRRAPSFVFRVVASSGSTRSFFITRGRKHTYKMYNRKRVAAGITPAMKSCPIDSSTRTPYKINPFDGGINVPTVAPATVPIETRLLYPRSYRIGRHVGPLVAVAGP